MTYSSLLQLRYLLILLTVILSPGCGPSVIIKTPVKPKPVHSPEKPCTDFEEEHQIFEISVDGRDVSREVRSVYYLEGPFGEEMLNVSHLTHRMRSGELDYDRQTIRYELTHKTKGILLRGSYISMENFTAKVALVGFNGTDWDRVVEIKEDVTDPISVSPTSVSLSENEIIGMRLFKHMFHVAYGSAAPDPISYYDPSMNSPVTFTFSKPLPGVISSNSESETEGIWISAMRNGIERIRVFFDPSGRPLEEYYPALHQVRRLVSKPVSLPTATSNPIMGLFSNTYLGLPNIATYAKFKLTVAKKQHNDALSFLNKPDNQTLTELSENEFTLKVTSEAPDGSSPPNQKDLSSSQYIKPDATEIKNALRYIRSGGKKGSLSKIREQNSAPVIAHSALITNSASFWKNPDKVAELLMRFVYALLPNKHHTFSMANAVQTLNNGSGDCTEHSVLFASLMRANKIPTRLVAGIYLSQGGSWIYHMWAEYWDGDNWQSIDPGNSIFKPGALYVSLGPGAAEFSELRSDVANFIDRSFSGVSFNLESANAEGEPLRLARPRSIGKGSTDHFIFNAAIAANRGNYAQSLELFDKSSVSSKSLVRNSLLRLELLVNLNRWKEALSAATALRGKTSLASNVYLLDSMSFKALVGLNRLDEAEKILESLCERLEGDNPSYLILKSRLLFKQGHLAEALELLANGIKTNPKDTFLLTEFISMVGKMPKKVDAPLLSTTLKYAREALAQTLFSKKETIWAIAKLLFKTGDASRAATLTDHGLILAPFDKNLLNLRDELNAKKCK